MYTAKSSTTAWPRAAFLFTAVRPAVPDPRNSHPSTLGISISHTFATLYLSFRRTLFPPFTLDRASTGTIPLLSHQAREKQNRLTAQFDYPLSGTRVYGEQIPRFYS